jgi:hypothetical protein
MSLSYVSIKLCKNLPLAYPVQVMASLWSVRHTTSRVLRCFLALHAESARSDWQRGHLGGLPTKISELPLTPAVDYGWPAGVRPWNLSFTTSPHWILVKLVHKLWKGRQPTGWSLDSSLSLVAFYRPILTALWGFSLSWLLVPKHALNFFFPGTFSRN